MLSKKTLKKIPIIRRVYPSLMKIFYKNKKIKFKFFGLNLVGNFGEPMDKEIFLFNNYENLQIEFLINNIKKYNLKYFIDVGANSGIYSLIVKNKYHKIKIKSFEPVKKTVTKFKDNLKLNKKLKNIKLYEFGLSNKDTKLLMKAQIRDGYIQSSGYGVVKKEDNLKNLHTENNIFKIGDNIIKLKNRNISIKIDAEGHEQEVLQGLKKLLKYNKIFLQIEIFDKNFNKINKYLKKQNFKFLNSIYSDGKTDYYYKNF
jgi:FkbM family methyltransferase